MRGAAEILDLELLWAQTRGDPGICIAVLDGPVDEEHPCFRGAHLAHLPTTADPACGGGTASSHGTHVASIIFGQHDGPVRGVAPGCAGLIAPIFADEGSLSACSQLDIARAVLQAVEAGAHVINISAGQFTTASEPDPLLARAIQYCADKNVLIVAAVGNDGCECIHVPAAATSVLSVGAMDANGAPMDMSNWGLPYRTQGVLAPGTNILGAVPGGGTARKSATSFATPIVSGIVGLLLSLQLRSGRKPDPHGIAKLILETAHPCLENGDDDCRKYLSGRINVPALLRSIQIGEPKMTEVVSMSDSERPIETALAGPVLLDAAAAERAPLDLARALNPAAFERMPPLVPASATAQVRMSDAGAAQLRDLVTPSHGCGCGGKCGGGKECTCGAAKPPPALVYALGTIGFDFASEARRDLFVQGVLTDPRAAEQRLDFTHELVDFLGATPHEAESLIWTLNLDATPIYAIFPSGLFAAVAYQRLREALQEQKRRHRATGVGPGLHRRKRAAAVGPDGPGARPRGARHALVVDAGPRRFCARTRSGEEGRAGGVQTAGGRPRRFSEPHLLRPPEPRHHPRGQGAQLRGDERVPSRRGHRRGDGGGAGPRSHRGPQEPRLPPGLRLLRCRAVVLQPGQHQRRGARLPLHDRRQRRHSGEHRDDAVVHPAVVSARKSAPPRRKLRFKVEP